MKRFYRATLKGCMAFIVYNNGNTIGSLYMDSNHYKLNEEYPAAVCVNDEVLFFGVSVGFLKHKYEINEKLFKKLVGKENEKK
ncbi:hypothetical protein KJ934_00290 [Patescibacteria group bacterium]|nr:hypothetical protein [Patescibacteria group bacterium]MBU4353461.1 hypothetical protein [Patescibacteria group bacterium]MBU4477455.1 hypothetical protein [Patescibacteria group bacterium]MCG2699114.1 hypothetical protein [Candidatus Parcubacteria bacterium]